MYIRDPNGSVYSGSTFSPAYLPVGSEESVKSLVPAGVCLPTGTSSCLSRYAEATKGSAPGYAVGLTTSLGNTFWYPGAEDAPGNVSVYYDALGATYFDYALASVGCGVKLPNVPVGSVRVDASVAVLGTGSFQTYVYVYRSTAAIPPAGSHPGGADARVAQCFLSGSASGPICSLGFVDGGLTSGVTYYYYVAASTTGSFASEILGGTPVQTSVMVEPL
ncbi:MAG TPA: hypothetical protein VKF15_00355, partial [Nitrososphaerales archaeon]|nr:hypothetical protein [Nitrososphaerales archaeon]